MHKFTVASVKQTVFTLLALSVLTTAFSQGRKPATPPGKGGRSNDNNPRPTGMILSSENAATAVLTPTGWGSTESFAFIAANGTPRQLYGSIPDLGVRAGVGVGDARKTVSVVGIVNVYDASALADFRLRDVTYSLVASRALGKHSSISVGSLNAFRDTAVADGVHSLFAAYSWSAKNIASVTPGNPRLSFTIGVGSGHFYYKSPLDHEFGRGRTGTGVFANVSYDVVKNLSVNAEWTGLNLGLTTAYRLPGNIATIYGGVANLTRYSGDKVTAVFGIGRAFGLKK